jgi:hypothetical protein
MTTVDVAIETIIVWTWYPFTVSGVNFVSKVNPESSLGKRIESMPVQMVDKANARVILDLIGDPSLLSREELVLALNLSNEGSGGSARIELASE